MELEDKAYESWKAWASSQVQAIHTQRDSAYTGVGTEPEEVGIAALEEDLTGVMATA